MSSETGKPVGRSIFDSFLLIVALGFGAGKVPWAPGTFGTLVGVGWFLLLASFKSGFIFGTGCVVGVVVSVVVCGQAERILKQKDPGSVVLDEIIAVPICMAAPLYLISHTVAWPPASWFLGPGLWITVSAFLAFRVFDIWKPWPVRQSQSLPGGWGVTVDDVLAAVYTNLVTGFVTWRLLKSGMA